MHLTQRGILVACFCMILVATGAALPAPVADFHSNVTGGYPYFSVLFTDDSTNTPTDWFWLFPGGGDAHTQNAVWTFDYYIGNSEEQYDIKLNASNAGGYDWENKTKMITAYPLSANFVANVTSGTIPLSVKFTDTTGNGTPSAWDWDFGGLDTSALQDPVFTFTAAGTYYVSLNASNLYSWDIENKAGYITATAPVHYTDFYANKTSICVGETILFTDTSEPSADKTYWDFGDGTADTENVSVTHSYATPGVYSVNHSRSWGPGDTIWEYKTDYISVANCTLVEANATYIYAPDRDYVPIQLWLPFVILMVALFGHSLIFQRNTDLTASMAAVIAFLVAYLSNMIGYIDIDITDTGSEIFITPTIKAVHPPWLVWVMLMFAFVALLNIFLQIYILYLKPKDWNEIYNRKIGKY